MSSLALNIRQSYSNLTDEELVEIIVTTNNTTLFEVLYNRYSRVVFNKCFSFSSSKNEAEDLTQDIFLKLFLKLNTFKAKSKFSTWLYSFTYNHCISYINRDTAKKIEKKSVMLHNKEFGLYTLQERYIYATETKVKKIKKALDRISIQEKQLLILKYQKLMTIKELESILNISKSAVKMRLKRAKEKLISQYYIT